VAAPLGGLIFSFLFRRDPKKYKIFEGNAITFLISRTTLRGFFAIPAIHRRNFFSTLEAWSLEGLLRPCAMAPIGHKIENRGEGDGEWANGKQ
jgi:hypothetical protein